MAGKILRRIVSDSFSKKGRAGKIKATLHHYNVALSLAVLRDKGKRIYTGMPCEAIEQSVGIENFEVSFRFLGTCRHNLPENKVSSRRFVAKLGRARREER